MENFSMDSEIKIFCWCQDSSILCLKNCIISSTNAIHKSNVLPDQSQYINLKCVKHDKHLINLDYNVLRQLLYPMFVPCKIFKIGRLTKPYIEALTFVLCSYRTYTYCVRVQMDPIFLILIINNIFIFGF